MWGSPNEPWVLDGGLATELGARGHDLSDALWSARLLRDAPEEVLAAHAAFFRAGARIATSASYQASFAGFAAQGMGTAETAMLLRRGVELARRAGARVLDEPFRVAASVGPYGAVLADGSEYVGRYGLSHEELVAFHRPRLEALAEAAPDVFAVETIPDVVEARALVSALRGLDVPAWLSYTITGSRTRAGQTLREAFEVAEASPDIVAVGVNCCSPVDAADAVAIAGSSTGKPVIAYPNSGERWDRARGGWVGPTEFSTELVRRCVANGARIIGGCCRVGPNEIASIAGTLTARGTDRCE